MRAQKESLTNGCLGELHAIGEAMRRSVESAQADDDCRLGTFDDEFSRKTPGSSVRILLDSVERRERQSLPPPEGVATEVSLPVRVSSSEANNSALDSADGSGVLPQSVAEELRF